MAIETDVGCDDSNPASTRVHKIKKEDDVETSSCDKKKLEYN